MTTNRHEQKKRAAAVRTGLAAMLALGLAACVPADEPTTPPPEPLMPELDPLPPPQSGPGANLPPVSPAPGGAPGQASTPAAGAAPTGPGVPPAV